jgi:hypothetical protein
MTSARAPGKAKVSQSIDGHSLGDEIDLETSARVGKVRFSGSWQVLSFIALQRCIKASGVSEPWRLRKLALYVLIQQIQQL